MVDDADLPQLLRYISGESPPDEVRALQARLERDPEFRRQVEAWQRLRAAQPPAWDTEQALAALQQELRFGAQRTPTRVMTFPLPASRTRGWWEGKTVRIAAMLLAVAGGAVLWRAVRTSHPASDQATVTALQEYATARGQRTTVHLADGTQVLLAAETRLLVPRDFGRPGARREVQLEGQAHFTVTHDAARPFVVRTATSVTEDLGTTFAIRAYPAEPEVEVVLAEGRVAVQPAHGSPRSSARSVLVPGDLARIDAEGHLQTTHAVNLSRYLAWTTGSLVFEGVPFRQAALDIERWYDLDIRLADPALGARRISGTVAGESIDAVLGYLALVLNARYEVAGKTVTFSLR